MNLTNNFALAELTYNDIAKTLGIDNPLPPYLIGNVLPANDTDNFFIEAAKL